MRERVEFKISWCCPRRLRGGGGGGLGGEKHLFVNVCFVGWCFNCLRVKGGGVGQKVLYRAS